MIERALNHNLSAMHGEHPSKIIICLMMSAQYQTKPTPPSLPVHHLEMKRKRKTMMVSLASIIGLVHFIDLHLFQIYIFLSLVHNALPRKALPVLLTRVCTHFQITLFESPLFPLALLISTTWWIRIAGPTCILPYSSPTCACLC